jgi:hypothetical protein
MHVDAAQTAWLRADGVPLDGFDPDRPLALKDRAGHDATARTALEVDALDTRDLR